MQPEKKCTNYGTKKGALAPFHLLIKVFKQKNFRRIRMSGLRLDYGS